MLGRPSREELRLLAEVGDWFGATVPSTQSTFLAGNSHGADGDGWEITDAAQTGLNFAASFTQMIWVRYASLPTTTATLLIKGDNIGTGIQYKTEVFPIGGGNFALQQTVVQDPIPQTLRQINRLSGPTAFPSPVVGVWNQYTATYDQSVSPSTDRIRFFVNGADKGIGVNIQDQGITGPGSTVAPFDVGFTRRAGNLATHGDLSNLMGWSRALTPVEVGQIWNRGVQAVANLEIATGFNGDPSDSSGNTNTLVQAHGDEGFTAASPPVT